MDGASIGMILHRTTPGYAGPPHVIVYSQDKEEYIYIKIPKNSEQK
jgi:hypothetical protein